jgi:NADH-quinone oxidoreductase subunit N
MTFYELIHDVLVVDTLGRSLWAFRPELTLCATIILILLARTIAPRWNGSAYCFMLLGTAAALYLAIPGHGAAAEMSVKPAPIFTGMLVYDSFSIFMRSLLLLFALLFATFTHVTGVPDPEDSSEFYVLILGALLGMCLMVSANHMLIVVLGVEMASVPSYVLAGILKQQRQSTEAALKYAVFGAATAGVMLYGISLLVGVLGSAHLPTMAVQLSEMLLQGQSGDRTVALVLGGLMVMVGLAFKLSAVPFHFWAPDVFEGAPAEVAAFLSIASKAAALALLVRLALGFSYFEQSRLPAPAAGQFVQVATWIEGAPAEAGLRAKAPPALGAGLPTPPNQIVESFQHQAHVARLAALKPAREYIGGLVALLAAITCTFGNLAAYGQTNMKRLLAYSTIAHAGYLMMPVAAAVAAAGQDPDGARFAVASMAFYIAIYLFMNFGAFAVVAFLRNVLGSEAIADYAGLIRRSPGLAVCTAIILFSLVGLPPLAGFAAKFAIFAALFQSRLLVLLAIGGLNTVLSLFYYLRVVRVMVSWPEPADRPAPVVPLASIPGAYCAVLTLPLLVLFVWWGKLFDLAQAAASSLLY